MNRPLETGRLSLRPFTNDDAEAWHAIWGDPEVIWWGADETFEKSRTSLERLVAAEASWPDGIGWLAVCLRGADEIIGDVLLQPSPYAEGYEIGWHLRTHAWGRGYATEAARAVAERCFAEGACDRLFALVEPGHRSSERVAEKLGMAPESEIEVDGVMHRIFAIGR